MPQRAVCSMCGERSRTKMATFYWAWYWPSGDRRSYKQRFDAICAMGILARVNGVLTNPDHCVVCKERVTDGGDVTVYATVYIPGRERIDLDLPYDAKCFEHDADSYMQGADRLLDRPLGAGGPPPQAQAGNPWEDWDQMGITPT